MCPIASFCHMLETAGSIIFAGVRQSIFSFCKTNEYHVLFFFFKSEKQFRNSVKRIINLMRETRAVATPTRIIVCQLVTRMLWKPLPMIAPAHSTWSVTMAYPCSASAAMDCSIMQKRIVAISRNMWTVWITSAWDYRNYPICSFYPARLHVVNTIFAHMACQRITHVPKDCISAQTVIAAIIRRKPTVR